MSPSFAPSLEKLLWQESGCSIRTVHFHAVSGEIQGNLEASRSVATNCLPLFVWCLYTAHRNNPADYSPRYRDEPPVRIGIIQKVGNSCPINASSARVRTRFVSKSLGQNIFRYGHLSHSFKSVFGHLALNFLHVDSSFPVTQTPPQAASFCELIPQHHILIPLKNSKAMRRKSSNGMNLALRGAKCLMTSLGHWGSWFYMQILPLASHAGCQSAISRAKNIDRSKDQVLSADEKGPVGKLKDGRRWTFEVFSKSLVGPWPEGREIKAH